MRSSFHYLRKKRKETLSPLNYYRFFKRKFASITPYPDRELSDIVYHLTGKDIGIFLISPISQFDMRRVFRETYRIALKRRRRIPLDYILGRSFFMDIELEVNPSVLIPRPDTEILVEEVLKHKPGRVVDMGTGSGNIGIVLAKHGFKVIATDISKKAIDLAKNNARLNNVEMETILCPFFECFEANAKFDYIVSNPPYVSIKEYESLDMEVKKEPYEALVSGCDGLWHSLNILQSARTYLRKGGYVFIEISPFRTRRYVEIAQGLGYTNIELIKDYNDNYRVLKARWI